MDTIDRRRMLQGILCGVTAAALGTALLPKAVEGAPLPMQGDFIGNADDRIEEVRFVVDRRGRPVGGRRPVRGRRPVTRRRVVVVHRRPVRWRPAGPWRPVGVRRRGWACWWSRGLRVCGWR